MQQKNYKIFIFPIVAISIFTLILFAAGFAYFNSTLTMATSNYQINMPLTTSLVCSKTDCSTTVTPAMMTNTNTNATTAKATSTCYVNCTCSGTPGAVCNYNVSLIETGMPYMSSANIGTSKEFSVKVTSPTGCSAANTSSTETQVNSLRERVVSKCSLTVPSGGSVSANVSAVFKFYNLDLDQTINENKVYKYELKTEDVLPPEYQQVDYISSSGNQWINTGVNINNKNYQVYADYQYNSFSSSSPTLIGCAPSTGGSTRFYPLSPPNGTRGRSSYGSQNFFIENWSGTARHIILYNDVNHRIYEDSVLLGTANPSNFTVPNVNLGLFALNLNSGADYYANAKVYAFKVYDGTQLVRNMIPCYLKGDTPVVGMYDLVNGVFYESANSYTFISGSDI